MTAGRVVVVHGSWGGSRAEAVVAAVAAALGGEQHHVTVPARAMPKMSPEDRKTLDEFVATPEVLVEGWRAARHLEALTRPGDTVVVSELAASGSGFFALAQAATSPDKRRSVIVAAGDGEVLRHLAVAGTIDGVAPEAASAIDWELVAYRYADAVLTTSQLAATLLDGLSIEAAAVTAVDPITTAPTPRGGPVFIADPPSRLARTGEILRALSGVEPAPEVFVASGGSTDHIFGGDTWGALADVREVFGERLQRGEPDAASIVVVGDPFRVPDASLTRWRNSSAIAVTAGSAVAVRWPETIEWSDADALAAIVGGAYQQPERPALPPPVVAHNTAWADARARQVSVAIPVFRDVRFLEECVASVLDQSQPPHEIMLIDDGSASPEVTEALETIAAGDDRIRLLDQPNRGVCVARNRAWDSMTGDASLFVDADDVLDPEFIEATADALRADPAAWAVATWTRFFGNYEGIEAKPPFDRRVGLRENPIIGTSVLLGQEVKDAAIRFAPDLAFLYCEDWELWSQITAAGGRIGLVARPLAGHRVHPSSGGHRRTELAQSLGKARATALLRG